MLLLLLPLLLHLFGGACSLPPPSPNLPPAIWSGPQIAVLNVMLPPRMTNPVQYRVHASGGCFTWSWDHHDILYVEPEYNGTTGCSTSAILTSTAPYSGRKETAVYATHVQSGAVIRCEIYIDKITRIRIFHHSVKLDLGGLTTLQIHAFDDNENVFSSLVGLQFNWNLMPKSSNRDSMINHLVHVPLKETPLSDCGGFYGDLDTRIQLEDSNVGADLYVVKGIEIGHEIVEAHLLETNFEHVMDRIILTVAELMSLVPPSPVFIIIGTSIHYRLVVIRENSPTDVNLPSLYHRWSISNRTVAEIDTMTGIVRTFKLGTTSVVVEDTRVTGHKQTSVLHVVIPDRLALYIIPVTSAFDPLDRNNPLQTWYVVTGQQYVVHMKVFSQKPEDREIYLTEDNILNLESDEFLNCCTTSIPTEIAVKYGWQNSRSFRAQSEGVGTLKAFLSYHRGVNIEILKVEQEVIACNKVVFESLNKNISEVIRLPWAPGLHQEFALTATGGCAQTSKNYYWFSSNKKVATISPFGILCAIHPGRAIITVVSMFDSTNSAEVVVEVSIPSSMIMLPFYPVEAKMGTNLHAAVSLNSPDGNYYDKCDVFSSSVRWGIHSGRECFRISSTGDIWPFDSPSHVNLSESLIHTPCAWTSVSTSCHAQAMLQATCTIEMHSPDNFFDQQLVLQATKRIASYPPLSAEQAGDGNQFGGYSVQDSPFGKLEELYLVPGTTMDVVILGGPDKWEGRVEYVDAISITGDGEQYLFEDFVVKNEFRNSGRMYTILCQSVGSYRLHFLCGNLVGDDHPLQTVETKELTLLCSFPSLVTLVANEHANILDVVQSSVQDLRGPGGIHLSHISVANNQTIRLSAVGILSSGSAFANSSSLKLRWDLVDCQDIAHWDEKANSDRSLSTWERFIVLHEASGQCIVRATIIGFNLNLDGHIFSEEIYQIFERTVNGLTDALSLQLVSSLGIIPEFVLLVSNREAKNLDDGNQEVGVDLDYGSREGGSPRRRQRGRSLSIETFRVLERQHCDGSLEMKL